VHGVSQNPKQQIVGNVFATIWQGLCKAVNTILRQMPALQTSKAKKKLQNEEVAAWRTIVSVKA